MSIPVDPNEEITMNRQWAEQVFSSSPDYLPFSFVYGGKSSTEFLPTWPRKLEVEQIGSTVIRRTVILTDPATRLEVKAVCLVYLDTPGVDWTIFFTNQGDNLSLMLEQIKAVDSMDLIGQAAQVILHRLNGSLTTVDDWKPFDQQVVEGRRIDFGQQQRIG